MVQGPPLIAIGVGGVFLYAGIKGKPLLSTVQSILQGAGPGGSSVAGYTPGPAVVEPSDVPPPPVTGTQPVVILQQTANQFGWGTGNEWQALLTVATRESGVDPTARNPSSGAWGIAQSLGHGFVGGPASNGVNEYGGYGLSPAQSRAASLGDPKPQCLWMCRYIRDRYGDPLKALAYWNIHGNY